MASKIPAFASKHDAYKIVSSRPWKFDIFLSNSCKYIETFSVEFCNYGNPTYFVNVLCSTDEANRTQPTSMRVQHALTEFDDFFIVLDLHFFL